jgi:hypothetical protein
MVFLKDNSGKSNVNPLLVGQSALVHNILEPTRGVIFFNSGFKSDPTKLFFNSTSHNKLTPKCRTYDRGIKLSIHTQFSTLYSGKIKNLHFLQMKDCIHYEL